MDKKKIKINAPLIIGIVYIVFFSALTWRLSGPRAMAAAIVVFSVPFLLGILAGWEIGEKDD